MNTMKKSTVCFLVLSFCLFSLPVKASGEGLVFRNNGIQTGTEVKTAPAGSEAVSSSPAASVIEQVSLYAESMLSRGEKQEGYETIELATLGVLSCDFMISENEKLGFIVDSKLIFQHWGGDKTSAASKFSVTKDLAPQFFASPEIKTFRQNFVDSIIRELSQKQKTADIYFFGQLQKYLDRVLQEMAIKQQPDFVHTIQDFKRKIREIEKQADSKPVVQAQVPAPKNLKENEPVQTSPAAETRKTKTVPTAEPSVFSEEEKSDLEEEKSLWSQLRENPSGNSFKAPEPQTAAKPVLKEESPKPVLKPAEKAAPKMEEDRDAEIEHALLKLKPQAPQASPIPPVPKNTPEVPKPKIPEPVEELSKEVPAPVPPPKPQTLPSGFQTRTPFHVLLAEYYVFGLKREMVSQRSVEFRDLSTSMAEVKGKLKAAGYYQKKPKERSAIEQDVKEQLKHL